MAYVAVEKVLRLPPVFLGVGETASTRVTVHHTFRMERLSIVLPWSRISGLLRASDIRHLDVVSVKIGSDEFLSKGRRLNYQVTPTQTILVAST